MFYGIVIAMYPEIGGRHHVPRFHADYQGKQVAMTLDGEVLEGDMPPSKLKLVAAWAEIHKEGSEIFRIDPLR